MKRAREVIQQNLQGQLYLIHRKITRSKIQLKDSFQEMLVKKSVSHN